MIVVCMDNGEEWMAHRPPLVAGGNPLASLSLREAILHERKAEDVQVPTCRGDGGSIAHLERTESYATILQSRRRWDPFHVVHSVGSRIWGTYPALWGRVGGLGIGSFIRSATQEDEPWVHAEWLLGTHPV